VFVGAAISGYRKGSFRKKRRHRQADSGRLIVRTSVC
jgi:hypothetical protein